MARVTTWKPGRAWHVYPAPGGFREYRHGHRGARWALIPAATARRLLPWLDGTPLPDAARGGITPPGTHAFYAARLDCAGRLDRVIGSAETREAAGRLCADDAAAIAEAEARHFSRAGKRPCWQRIPPGARMLELDEKAETVTSVPVNPRVLRSALLAWRLRRLADMTRRPRAPRVPPGPVRVYTPARR